jgi:ABC-type Fe3+-hydroxamate transport system substrate-binding protein
MGPRVVSLLPSATEAVCAVGGGSLLVGRSHECDYPPQVARLPALTGARTGAGTDAAWPTPEGIDRQVRTLRATGESLYTLDEAALAALRPDLIITQDLCTVCSIDLERVRRVASGLGHPVEVLSLNPQTVEDVLDDLLTIGSALGLERSAERAVCGLRERLYTAADFANPFVEGPSVAFLEWCGPLYVGGHWTPQLIERAGARHPLNPTIAVEGAGAGAGPIGVTQRRAGPSVRVPPEVLAASGPDHLIVCPCGEGLGRVREQVRALSRQDWWRGLPAVRGGRVALVDGNHFFNRPGPRLVDAFEWLVGWLHGRADLIPPDFAWEVWNGDEANT